MQNYANQSAVTNRAFVTLTAPSSPQNSLPSCEDVLKAQQNLKEGFTDNLYHRLDYLDDLGKKDRLNEYEEAVYGLFKDGDANAHIEIIKEAFANFTVSDRFRQYDSVKQEKVILRMFSLIWNLPLLEKAKWDTFDQAEDNWYKQQMAVINSCKN